MMTAKVFENGRSQTVCLLKECRFGSDEVAVLMPRDNKWADFWRRLNLFSEDFMSDGRAPVLTQKREVL